MKNKIFILLFLLSFILSTTVFAVEIYKENKKEIIANGIELNKQTIFSENGWIYFNVVEIDINNPDISILPIYSSKGVNNFSTIKSMISDTNIVAALNGDYFARRNNSLYTGQSIGLLGKDSQILVSSAEENDGSNKMGSFILQKDNNIIYSYLKNTITIYSDNKEETYFASGINKYVPYNAIGILTSIWNETSIGNSENENTLEVLVIDNKIVEIRDNLEGIAIPKNGYILHAYGPNAKQYILNNYSIGDNIFYKIDINLDVEKMKLAISGGTILVENGKITSFSHLVWGTNEMSAIGSNKDNTKIYLIASSPVTQKQFAELINNYGIYNALCLDGGGSTTMIIKQPTRTDFSIISSRFTNYLRPVVNGIGINKNLEPTNIPYNLVLTLKDKYIFKNNSTTFILEGYDTNYYPINIDMNNISVTFNNDNAVYENNQIIGKKEGFTTITVKYENISISKELRILGEAYSLTIEPSLANIQKTDTQNFTVYATDKNGYTSKINNELLLWNIEQGSGEINNGTFIPYQYDQTIISASIDNIKSFSLININQEEQSILDSFETLNGTFSAYPNTVTGDINIYSNKHKTGKYALKLTYNFINNENAVRGAYYDYTSPIVIPDLTTEIGIWIYSPIKNQCSIKSQFKDIKGNTYIAVLANEIDWIGWKYLTYTKPEKIKEITSLYIAQSNVDLTDFSYIYFDDLTVIHYSHGKEEITLPKNISIQDNNNYVLENSYKLSILDSIYKPSILFDQLLNKRVINNINSSNLTLTYNEYDKSYSNIITTNICTVNNITQSNNYADISYFDISNNGIRATNYEQWYTLINTLNTSKKHQIIVFNKDINTMSDSLEKELLYKLLQEYKSKNNKECWIIQPGEITSTKNYNNIKIVSIGNRNTYTNIMDIYNNYKYIDIYINENNMTYVLNSIFY
ncbi:MAG: phosphodiester glycosidase family protein [Clostridia bacterium]|nr:phosphodiester glycosidase family protein [Clostridia bacterium]